MSKSIKANTTAPTGDDRQTRLAAELRANLLKRKAFARGQASEEHGSKGAGEKGGTTPDDTAE